MHVHRLVGPRLRVLLRGDPHGLVELRIEKIGKDEDDGPFARDPVQVLARVREIRASAAGLEVEEVADHPEHVSSPFARWNVHFDFVRENDGADTIVVLDGAECEKRPDLRGDFPLEPRAGAEIGGGARVEDEEHGELALFGELLDVESSSA